MRCSCDTPSTHSRLRKEPRRGCSYTLDRDRGGVASAPLRLESVAVHPVYGNPRKGLLRTFWEPDWVVRGPQLPYKKSVSAHPVHGNPQTGLLRTF